MVDRILTLGLGFVFDAPGDCNFNMVRESLANWMPKKRSNQVKIRGQVIEFSPIALNRLLGTPHVDPQSFVNIVKKPPYRDIRHTLCGSNSVARWTRHQQFGERVCLVYELMTEMLINVGVLIKNVLKRARMKKGQNFGFGGLLTRFLRGHDIEEEEADYRPAYDRGIDVTKMKSGPRYEDPLDDDMATEDEMERVDVDIEYSDDNEEDSEMGEASLAPTDDEK
ncbi:hypothetical protein HAX54_041237 [Datura stramonium]|uniref:Putative plant transposon protein domain-containing protein n=1 Tax=Datura stramonium TaxID=4076 RepID=A0ABS8VQW3_DATST|nr:hypothetical protein [Datura stramonium]